MTTPKPTVLLAGRGLKYWASLVKIRNWGPGELLLIEEACRIVDRLDKLDALLSGDIETWARVYSRNDDPIDLHLDQAMGEARQHANVLRQIIVTLDLPKAQAPEKKARSALDDLAAQYSQPAGSAGTADLVDAGKVSDIGSARRRARTDRRAGA